MDSSKCLNCTALCSYKIKVEGIAFLLVSYSLLLPIYESAGSYVWLCFFWGVIRARTFGNLGGLLIYDTRIIVRSVALNYAIS